MVVGFFIFGKKKKAKPAPSNFKIQPEKIQIPKENKLKLEDLLQELERQIEETEKLRSEIEKKHVSFFSPKDNKRLLEEIEVPALELLRDEPRTERRQKKSD
jgi:hypothetical protein